jgi:uncharacterized coiled-coil protein SlyX
MHWLPFEKIHNSTNKIQLMKKCFTLLVVALFSVASWAQNADYLLKKDFQSEKKKISEGIDAAKKAGIDAKRLATKQVTVFDSLEKLIASNEKTLKQTNDSLQNVTAKFKDLEVKVTKTSMNAQNYLLLAVIVIAIIFLLLLALIFFLKSKSDEKILELSEENSRMEETLKQEVLSVKDELKKSIDQFTRTIHEQDVKTATRIDRMEDKQLSLIAEVHDTSEKVMKEQAIQKSMIEERINEVISKLNSEKTNHLTLHDKIEMEVKGLRSLHEKDVEEIKAKL